MKNFKKVFNKFGDRNETFLDNLFDRFKLDKNFEGKPDKEEVDLQDLMISLAILARIPYEEKLKCTVATNRSHLHAHRRG